MFVHNNLRLLSCKDPKYKDTNKLWDVALEFAELDMTIDDLARTTLLDIDDAEDDATPSTAGGTAYGSNDEDDEILVAIEDPNDPHYLDNQFDD